MKALATATTLPAAGADLDAGLASVRAELEKRFGALRVEIRIIGALVFAMPAKMFGIFEAVANVLA